MEKVWFCLRIIASQRHVLRVSMQYFEMIKDVLTGLDYSFKNCGKRTYLTCSGIAIARNLRL